MGTNIGVVQQDTARIFSEGIEALLKLNRRGEACVIDFLTQAVLEGRGYQVRAGTITAPLTSDVLITDAAAEMCADAAVGLAIMPCQLVVDVESLGGTLPQVAAKSVGTVSSAGTAFTPLPLFLQNAVAKVASRATARVAAAGGVTVSAEVNTTTRDHFMRTMAVAGDVQAEWKPVLIPIIGGGACFYVQVGAVATGSAYFAHFDFLEFLLNVLE